jgi:Amt family ammonium transporter
MLGSLLVAFTALPQLGGSGLADGMTALTQLATQAMGVGVTALWSGIVTYGLIKLLPALTGVRSSGEEERDGLDLSEHGERAYDFN